MPRVRCKGCNGEYELDAVGEESPLCPLCNERHPVDRNIDGVDGSGASVFSRLAIALAVLVVIGLVAGLLWPRGEAISGDGRDALPAGPFTMSGPWTLRWECEENPRVVYVYQHVEGEAEPKLFRSFGTHKIIPKIAEREIPAGGTFTVDFHEQFQRAWTVSARE